MEVPTWFLRAVLRLKNKVVWFWTSKEIGGFAEWGVKSVFVFFSLGLWYQWSWGLALTSIGVTVVGERLIKSIHVYGKLRGAR